MIDTAELLKVFQNHRGNAIVIPGRGGKHWVNISKQPNRDLPMGDPAMGGHASFALGFALARPDQKVVLFDSEGDILMGIGALATIAEQQPKNLYHFMLDNEVYATTGGQPVPNAKVMAYDGLARACGYQHTHKFDNLERFSIEIGKILAGPAPVFIWLKVRPEVENLPINERKPWRKRSQAQAVADLQRELGIG